MATLPLSSHRPPAQQVLVRTGRPGPAAVGQGTQGHCGAASCNLSQSHTALGGGFTETGHPDSQPRASLSPVAGRADRWHCLSNPQGR